MASFEQHVTFSSLLGLGYGAAAFVGLEFTPAQAALSGCLTAVGGMLPDLDAPSGRPGKEIFGLTAAVVPLVLVGQVLLWTGLQSNPETIMLLLVGMYLGIRYGVASVVHKLCVHRGMFHSLPAMLISGELIYLGYPGETVWVKLLMAGGVTLGFFSHLLLDELYSVEFKKGLPSLKKSSGTAIKMYGPTLGPNVLTYAAVGSLSYLVMLQANLIKEPDAPSEGGAQIPVPAAHATGELQTTFSGIGETSLGEVAPAPVPSAERFGDAPAFFTPHAIPVNTAELDAPPFAPATPNPGSNELPVPATDAPVFR